MDAIEMRAPNPNVAVIHEAMQHFPEGSWMRGAMDHAAAELAVLHGRCQRAALTPPEGEALSESDKDVALAQAVEFAEYVERQAKGAMVDAAKRFLSLPYAQELAKRLAASMEVP